MAELITFISTFDNREKATACWMVGFVVFAMVHREIRKSFLSLLNGFFRKKILLLFGVIIGYVAASIWVLYKINLWGTFLVKDTIYWFLGTTLVLTFNANEIKDGAYLKELVIDALKLAVFIEFIVNFYVFSFWLELLLFPILIFVVGMHTVAKSDDKYASARKVLDIVLAIFGLCVTAYVIYRIISTWPTLLTLDNLRTFLLPICLTLMYLPFLYFLAVFFTYEELFTRIDIFFQNEQLRRITKRRIFRTCLFNLKKINIFSKTSRVSLYRLRDKEDVLELIAEFRRSYPSLKANNPPQASTS